MKISLFTFIFVLISKNLAYNLNGKLIFSHIIYRHGDRTIIDPYPTDPWGDSKFWSTGFGQLTNTGKMQHYQFGKWLRKRYDSLLNVTYNRDEIYVQSTDSDRTLMSALSNLAGLFEPKGKDIWNNEIVWQPIPVHTMLEKDDSVLAAKKYCLAYNNAYNTLKKSQKFQSLDMKYDYLYKYLTKYTGMRINSIEGVEKIYYDLYIEDLNNKTLPDWTKKVYPSGDMKYLADFSFTIPTYTRKLARLKIGSLIKEILERLKDKVKAKSTVKQSVWVYSAHDTTIANVLNGLKLFELHCPPFTSAIFIELRIDNENKPLVSIFYKNTTDSPEPLYIPNCGIQCPLESMFQLYEEILPLDWENECKLSSSWLKASNDFSSEYNSSLLIILLGLLISVGVFMTLVYFISMYYRRRRYDNYRCYVQ